MRKRGQIFVFAAVIISVIVMSMAGVANYAQAVNEPASFYDYSVDVQREAGLVIDYEVYTGFGPTDDIENFVDLLIADLRDRDSQANFLFIYGDENFLVMRNYGADVANAFINSGDQPISIDGVDLNITSTVSLGDSYTPVQASYDAVGQGGRAEFDSTMLGQDITRVDVTILKNDFAFEITEHNQVIFLIQKTDGEETYVST